MVLLWKITAKYDVLVSSLTEVGTNWIQFTLQFPRPVQYQIITTMNQGGFRKHHDELKTQYYSCLYLEPNHLYFTPGISWYRNQWWRCSLLLFVPNFGWLYFSYIVGKKEYCNHPRWRGGGRMGTKIIVFMNWKCSELRLSRGVSKRPLPLNLGGLSKNGSILYCQTPTLATPATVLAL